LLLTDRSLGEQPEDPRLVRLPGDITDPQFWAAAFAQPLHGVFHLASLPGILARPPERTGQLSAFMSDLVRELAAGRAFDCPTAPTASIWASSLPNVIANLLHAAAVDTTRLSASRSLLLPTLRLSMTELAEAIGRVYGVPAPSLVRWVPEDRIEALFGRYPPLCTALAENAGFVSDGDADSLVRRALEPA